MSPTKLIVLDIAGSVFVCGNVAFVFLGASIPIRRQLHAEGFSPYFGTVLCIVALGALVSWRTHTTLSDGVRQERWTADQLRGPRAFLNHPAMRILGMAYPIAASIAFIAFLFLNDKWYWFLLYWCLFYLSTNLEGARRSLQEPRISSYAGDMRRPSSPLQSEYWGFHAQQSKTQ